MFREKLQAVFAPFWKSERVSPARVIILGFLLITSIVCQRMHMSKEQREGLLVRLF